MPAPAKELKLRLNSLKKFNGIGDKYARNIWMDVYDPDFHESIAIDEQVKNVTKAIGLEFKNYQDHEAFYQRLAKRVNLQPWAVDRLLFNFTPYFLWAIDPNG